MVVLLTRKNEEDSIKNEGARMFTTLYIDFLDAQGPQYYTLIFHTPKGSLLRNLWWDLAKLIQAFMHVLISSRMKNEGARVATRLYVNFSDIQGQITPVKCAIWQKFKLNPASKYVLTLPAQNEEDSIKNEGASVAKPCLPLLVYGYFFKPSRAANSQFVVRSGRNSNLSRVYGCPSYQKE